MGMKPATIDSGFRRNDGLGRRRVGVGPWRAKMTKTNPQLALLTILIIAASAGALLLSGCGNNRFERDLAAALSTDPDTISFAAIAQFQWDSVEIYGPYTPADQLSPAAFDGSSARSQRMLGISDSHHLIVFIKNDRAVDHELLSLGIADFRLDAGRVSLRRAEAEFVVSRRADAGGFTRTTLLVMR